MDLRSGNSERPSAPLVWITGAAGFLGSHAARGFEARGYRVVCFSRRPYVSAVPRSGNAAAVGAFASSILQEASAKFGIPDIVIHCIGTGSVSGAERDPKADIDGTIRTTETLIEYLEKRNSGARLIYLSSAAIYGDVGRRKMQEALSPNPVSVYGKNKLAAENICLNANIGSKTVVRLFSVFGPPQKKLLFWDIGNKMLQGEGELVLNGTGDESRDFVHVHDVVSAIIKIAEHRNSASLINIGSGHARTIRDVTQQFLNALNVTARVRFNGFGRPGDPSHQEAAIDRLISIGFSPRHNLTDGLAEYADWFRSQTASDLPKRLFAN